MSAERIRNAALSCFAAHGYDATSLADIAGMVGIKVPSIYAHFKSKQALFLQLVEDVSIKELADVQKALERPEPVQDALKAYIYETIERFETGPYLQFWLRSLYLPPPKLMAEIRQYDRYFSVSLEKIVSYALCRPEFGIRKPSLDFEILTAGFIGILRGVHAELLYGGKAGSNNAIHALWTIFSRSLVDEIA